jgi:hypothetical protein
LVERVDLLREAVGATRAERPFGVEAWVVLPINPIDLCKVVSVIPRRTHARIAAQNGAFLLYGLFDDARPGDITMGSMIFERIDIDASSKKKMLSELNALGISRDTLLPEIDNSASEIAKAYQ